MCRTCDERGPERGYKAARAGWRGGGGGGRDVWTLVAGGRLGKVEKEREERERRRLNSGGDVPYHRRLKSCAEEAGRCTNDKARMSGQGEERRGTRCSASKYHGCFARAYSARRHAAASWGRNCDRGLGLCGRLGLLGVYSSVPSSVCVRVCGRVSKWVRVCARARKCVCMYVRVCVHTYIHTSIPTDRRMYVSLDVLYICTQVMNGCVQSVGMG